MATHTNSSSFANSTERHGCVDDALKEELGQMYDGFPNSSEYPSDMLQVSSRRRRPCLKSAKRVIKDNTLFRKECGW